MPMWAANSLCFFCDNLQNRSCSNLCIEKLHFENQKIIIKEIISKESSSLETYRIALINGKLVFFPDQ